MSNVVNQAVMDARAATLTPFTAAHLSQAVGLSSEMGWPHRREDWAFAQRLGEGLALEQGGRLIGTAMRWPYGDAYATLGSIIVTRSAQGLGHGARLLDALIERAGEQSLLLNATREGLTLYGRRGFVPMGQLQQHQGVPAPAMLSPQGGRVRAADDSDLPAIIGLDQEAVGMPRGQLLRCLAEVGRLSVTVREGVVTGYAACRAFGRGSVIGPVVASDPADARALIVEAASRLPGAVVRVDTATRSGLGPWLEAMGLKCVDTVQTMARGKPPQPRAQARVYALCSQSLG